MESGHEMGSCLRLALVGHVEGQTKSERQEMNSGNQKVWLVTGAFIADPDR